MFDHRHCTAAALAAFLLPATAASADTAYDCEFKQHADNGVWIPEQIIVGQDPETGDAVAYDPIIHHFVGHPIEVKVETDNAKRTTYIWNLKVTSGSNQKVGMTYRITIFKADLKAQMTALPVGYADNFFADGRCKRVKG